MLGCSHPINRPYVIGEARPGRRTLITGNRRRPLPRAPSHLISAPLQSAPPETGAALFREPRGKEFEDETVRPYRHNRPVKTRGSGQAPFP